MAAALYLTAILLCGVANPSPALALGAGLLLALTLANPYVVQCKRLTRPLLQISVVLLGFTMNLYAVVEASASGLTFAIATIVGSFWLGAVLSRWLGVRSSVATLISAGTAICGGSAIAAVAGATGAEESDTSVALGTIFVLNGVALYLFPPLGRWLGLSQAQFGVWAGIAIHDISSVYGAARSYGAAALVIATAVKLARALWIFPVALVAARVAQREGSAAPRVPWFIFLFFAASMLSTFVAPVAACGGVLQAVAQRGLALTLFLIGSTLSMQALREVGWRPLVQGLLQWLLLGAGALLVVQRL